jgi:hypothetical protein
MAPLPIDGLDGLSQDLVSAIRESSYNVARFIVTFEEQQGGTVLRIRIRETYSTFPPHAEDWGATASEMILTGSNASENLAQFRAKVSKVYGSECLLYFLPRTGRMLNQTED